MAEMEIYNGSSQPSNQQVYDAYNNLLFSEDRHVLYKMLKRVELYDAVKHLPGDIVECGVFKGAGMALWLKLIELDAPYSIRKVIGFDFFDRNFVQNLPSDDKIVMSQVFNRCETSEENTGINAIRNTLRDTCNISPDKFELVKGDLSITSKKYVESKPGFRIALLYLDVDLEEPTYKALVHFWDRIISGGIVVFDEYGYHSWTESNAVDKFIQEQGLELMRTKVKAPTAYIVKP